MIHSLKWFQVAQHIRFDMGSRPKDIHLFWIIDFHQPVAIQYSTQQLRFSVRKPIFDLQVSRRHFRHFHLAFGPCRRAILFASRCSFQKTFVSARCRRTCDGSRIIVGSRLIVIRTTSYGGITWRKGFVRSFLQQNFLRKRRLFGTSWGQINIAWLEDLCGGTRVTTGWLGRSDDHLKVTLWLPQSGVL